MSATRTSGLVLAHWSVFYASRATIRNFILNKADPPYATALHFLADTTVNALPADDILVSTARARLDAMQQLCRHFGVELVLLIPPSLSRYNDLLASAAGLQHINFDYPLPLGALGPEYFRPDRTHLNEKGAAVFTDALARCLQTRLGKGTELGAVKRRAEPATRP
jgi:lysophospholipase L1-like esterase